MAEPAVLVVEDNDRNRKLVRDVLEFHGFRTLETGTGWEAVALAHAALPDLILLDIQLPDIDGVAVLAELRTDPTTASIPVVALTAFAMESDRERFLSAGFDGYLSKPLEVRALPEQVRRFCAQRGRRP